MKKSILVLLSYMALALSVRAQNCPGNINLISQEEIDAFAVTYPGCTAVTGSVYISGTDITNLNGLAAITSIEQSLIINDNPNLTDLTGLESVTNIGGSINFYNNPVLANLLGLNSVTSIGGTLQIQTNNSLTDLSGLNNLALIGGSIFITTNNSLTSLLGLNEVTSIYSLYIQSNMSLTDISDISSLIISGNLHITNNTILSTCSIQSICNKLSISPNSVEINGNATGCDNVGQVQLGCGIPITCPNNITFHNQAEINAFPVDYAGCNTINGTINIWGSDITNLYGLAQIISIEGELIISGNALLTNLSGLEAIDSIGQRLFIFGNSSLTDISALSGLEFIGGDLDIYQNSSLSDCSIQSICNKLNLAPANSVTIYGNENGCNSVAQVQTGCELPVTCPGNITFETQAEIDAYPSIYTGCYNISGNVRIIGNDITNLDGLNGITNIGGDLSIIFTSALTNITGLGAVTSIGGGLNFQTNTALTSLTGINAITSIGGALQLSYNPGLTSLTGLNSVTSIGGLIIRANNGLTNLAELDGITSIDGYVEISDNDALTNLSGLNGVTSLGALIVHDNPSLTSFTGLNSVTAISVYFQIYNNPSLTSLTALNSVTSLPPYLSINSNPILSACSIQSICDRISINPNSLFIYGNAVSCATIEEVQSGCSIDLDNDGFMPPLDCDDANASIYPGAPEYCNGLDDDCDGLIDANDPNVIAITWYQDNDSDGKGNPIVYQTSCNQPVGYVSNNLDCDDNSAAACPVPSAPSIASITDVSAIASWTGTGCAQRYNFQYKRKVDVVWNFLTLGANATNYTFSNLQPGTKYQWRLNTVCDTVSNVVSALTAVQNFTTKYRVFPDIDLDGYGNSASSSLLVATFPQSGYSLNNLDCNDNNNAINPGVMESCNNNVDDDCDGLIDASDPDIVVSTWYQDNDGDGKGNPAVSLTACSQLPGYVLNNLDCDDNNVAACPMPSAPATSAIIDISATASWTGTGCAQQYRLQYKRKVDANWIYINLGSNISTFVLNGLLPGTKYQWRISTACDTFSNILSNPIPVQNFSTKYRVYPDIDGDGYGNSLSTAVFVNTLPAPGYSTNNLDCLDSNGAVFPGSVEICNLLDDNCDGLSDEGFPTITYYRDLDNDGYGNLSVTILACTVPVGYVSNSTDCNDANFNIRPNAQEICNGGVDDDCDGLVDDADPGMTGGTTWYLDSDGDGLGNFAITLLSCAPPVGYVANSLDCNDSNSSLVCLGPSGLNISGISSNSATLSWVNSPCVSYYAVQYRPNATGPWFPASPFLVNGNSQLFTGLAPNTPYQYRIRALCNAINTNTPFITGTFTTLALPMAMIEPGDIGAGYHDFDLYPNPGDGVFNLRFDSWSEGTATVVVIDGLGKLVFTSDWSITNGLNVNQFNLSGISNGVYQVQVQYGEMVKSKKMVIVR